METIKVNELRFGNLVLYKGNVESIEFLQYNIDETGFEVTFWPVNNEKIVCLEDISPIPLTEDWLLKVGFEKGNQCYDNAYSLEVQKTDFYLRPSFEDGYYWGFNESEDKLDCELRDVKPLKYVHELQNLYFALTGKELEFK